MNDLRVLTDSILTDARTEAETIISQAQTEAARIISEAKTKAEAHRGTIAEEYQRKAEDLERRHQIAMDLEMKKRILATKHQVIERVFGQALKELNNLPAEKRIRFLAEKLAEAGGSGGGVVKGSGSQAEWASIVKVANEIIARSGSNYQLALSNESPDIEGGFQLIGPGYVINGSFKALLEEMHEELIPQIAGFLFEDEKG